MSSFGRTQLIKSKPCSRRRLKCNGTRPETRFRLSAKRTSPFKSAGASVLSTTGSRGVCNSGSNAGYTMFRGSVKSTGYPLHSPVSPTLPFPCVTVCHHISTGLYHTAIHTTSFNPLNAKLNPVCPLLALLGAHHIFHLSGSRVNVTKTV